MEVFQSEIRKRRSCVSVVMPALDEAENLMRAIPIVRSQIGPGDELIVVDNGSQDNTSAIAGSLGAKLVWEPVRGRSRTRNAGFRASRGEIVVFLDADCLPHNDWLKHLLAPFNDPNVGCVAGEIEIHHGNNPLGQFLNAKGYLTQQVNFQHPFLPFAGSGNVAFRRSVLERIGVFDEGLYSGHDADLCWRMQLETDFTIVLSSSAVVDHFQELTCRALVRQKRRHGYGSVLLYKKYWSHRRGEKKKLKVAYWEYRSILKRSLLSILKSSASTLRGNDAAPPFHNYQLFLEIAEKLGRIEGCLRHRIWFP